MQFPDGYLDQLFASGQKRYWDVLCQFDWNNDNYLSTYADLSDNYVTGTIDAQVNGELPEALQQEEGYSTARLDITLEGFLNADGTPVWKAFSPGAGHYLGQQARLGTHMSLAVVAYRPDNGTRLQIFQFTGVIDSIQPDRKDGTVKIVCFDYTALLNQPINLWRYGTDWTNRYYYGNTDSNAGDWIATSGVIGAAARAAGFFEGPRPIASCQAFWPLTGSFLPEVGTIALWDNTIPQWAYRGWITPGNVPATTPRGLYGPAKFGNGLLPGGGATFQANAKQLTAAHNNAATSTRPYYLGGGGWMHFGESGNTIQSNLDYYHENVQYSNNGAALTEFKFGADGSAASMTAKVSQSSTNNQRTWNWQFVSPVAVPAGWHWVGMVIEFTTTAVNAYINIDGTITAMTRQSGSGTMAQFLYGLPSTGTNKVYGGMFMAAQYIQIWTTSGASATDPFIWPERTPPFTNMAIDVSETRLFHTPVIDGSSAGDVIKAASGAEFGALYCTEKGVITWDSYSTLLARRTVAASVKTFTTDDLIDFQPYLALGTIANTITYMVKQWWSAPGKAFQLSTPGQFQIGPSSAPTYPITLDNVQAMRAGAVTFQPQAMGYTLQGAAVTNWKDWMQYYAPDTWNDGFTGYVPGSNSDPSTQPAYQTGVNAYAMLGWASGDQNSRHMRLQLQNSSGQTIEYAVNDQTAFLNVLGLVMLEQTGYSAKVSNAASVGSIGTQLLTLDQPNDYRSDSVTVATLMQKLVDATAQQRYLVNTVELPGDPRIQRQDVLTFSDPNGMGTVYASIIGINRTISKQDGLKDTYTLRTFTP